MSRQQQTKHRPVQPKSSRPVALTADMVRELQLLRKEREVMELERDNALELERQTRSKACSTVNEYKKRFDRLSDFIKGRAPGVFEQWKRQEEKMHP